jgi:hypothetical protein
MVRLDIRIYFILKRIYLFFFGVDTSWLITVRYSNIQHYEKLIEKLETSLIRHDCKILKREASFLQLLWNDTNVLNLRLGNPSFNEFDLHFYTSKIDVPYKSINKKISALSRIIEIIENNLDMVDRNIKQYELQIFYHENNPYYAYWIKTIPGEKIKSLNCKLYDNDNSVIEVNNNEIRFCETSMPSLFYKIKNYLSLRGV